MGTCIEFWLGAPDGLASIIAAELSAYTEWVQQVATEFPKETAEVQAALAALPATAFGNPVPDAATAAHIDTVVDGFVGDYCDHGGGRPLLPEAHGSMLYKRHYEAVVDRVEIAAGTAAVALWRYMLSGRGVGSGREAFPYRPSDDVFRVADWTLEECRTLIEALERGFGPEVERARRAERASDDEDRMVVQYTAEAVLTALAKGRGLVITAA